MRLILRNEEGGGFVTHDIEEYIKGERPRRDVDRGEGGGGILSAYL